MANTLAYYDTATITSVKNIAQAPVCNKALPYPYTSGQTENSCEVKTL